MPEKMKLKPEEKLDILMHILNLIDEQNMISFAEDKFGAYFNEDTKPFIESYLNALNSKKTLQFIIYGEPGMINEHYIKIASFEKFAREIKLQIDMIKAKHKDTVLAMNEEIQNLSEAIEKKDKTVLDSVEEEEKQRIEMAQKIDDTLAYSDKLSKSLKKNKNLSVLGGVVTDTENYLKAVKVLSEDYESMRSVILEPMLLENQKSVRKITFAAIIGIAALVFFGILAMLLF